MGDMTSEPIKRGIPCTIFHEDLDDKYKCNHCNEGLLDPVQTKCGHRYCRCCHQELTGHSHQVFCKGCTKDGSDEMLLNNAQIFPDKAIARELNEFLVKCNNDGCDWAGKLKAYRDHVEKPCDHEIISCIHKECKLL
ncbi:TNF receptor-associated factor 2-like [Ptychodera flava]|uniref:TNF receptor-associated factor 2-like n=1 Tax=Ptychodera flava TaxID=63121 RepID=UPI003969E914